jgi:hypothetical protein
VTFIGAGGVAEEGVDEGGVSREFFQLLVSELVRQAGRQEESRGCGCLWVPTWCICMCGLAKQGMHNQPMSLQR